MKKHNTTKLDNKIL